MRRFLKWFGISVLALGVVAFLAFLYFIPPFTLIPPEEFSRPFGEAGPALAAIADTTTRAMAERGHYLVTIGSCGDCHSTPGPEGPRHKDMYMAGGFRMSRRHVGTYVSMNLTPDQETGLGGYTDDEIKRVLRSGVSKDGSEVPGHLMPWPAFSNWTDEDLHAVVVYLRRLTPIVHRIPPPNTRGPSDPAAIEEDFGGKDYAKEVGQ
jgi:hypothetical protein